MDSFCPPLGFHCAAAVEDGVLTCIGKSRALYFVSGETFDFLAEVSRLLAPSS